MLTMVCYPTDLFSLFCHCNHCHHHVMFTFMTFPYLAVNYLILTYMSYIEPGSEMYGHYFRPICVYVCMYVCKWIKIIIRNTRYRVCFQLEIDFWPSADKIMLIYFIPWLIIDGESGFS